MEIRLAIDFDALDRIGRLPPEPALLEAAAFLDRTAGGHGFDLRVRKRLQRVVEGRLSSGEHEPLRLSPSGSRCELLLFVWAPGDRTGIHDHVGWGAFRTVAGSLHEERYQRLDNGSQSSVAHLRRAWGRFWADGAGVSTLMPYEGGIHRMANITSEFAASLHLYGPRTGPIDGRDYDPGSNFVCDRFA